MIDTKKEYGFEEEVDWMNVLTNPLRWFGLFYILLIVGIVVAGVYYLDNMNDIYKNNIDNSVMLPETVNEKEEANTFLIETKGEEIFKEAETRSQNIIKIVENIKNSNEINASLLRNCTTDLNKVVSTFSINNNWIASYDIFSRAILANIPNNGFNSNVTELSKEELLMIHSLLVSVLSNKIAENIE